MSADIYARWHQDSGRGVASSENLQRSQAWRRQRRRRRRGQAALMAASSRSSRDDSDVSGASLESVGKSRHSNLGRGSRRSGQEHEKVATSRSSDDVPPNFRLLDLHAAFEKNQTRIRSLQSEIIQLKTSEEDRISELHAILLNLRKRLEVGEVAASNAHEKLRDGHVKRVHKKEAELADILERQCERSWKNHAAKVGRICDNIREEIDMIDNAQKRMLIQASTKGVQWLLIGVRTVVSPMVRVLHCCGCRNTSRLSSYMDIEDYGVSLE